MNYMSEVAKMLGVELGERFKIDFNGLLTNSDYYDNYYFSDSGLKNDNHSIAPMDVSILYNLICGKCFIKRKPWKPEVGECYYFIDESGLTVWDTWGESYEDILLYKLGNFYKTREDADKDAVKWLAFYKSDEVLEV